MSQHPARFRLLVGTGRVLDAMAELYPQHLPGDRALQRIDEEEEERRKKDEEEEEEAQQGKEGQDEETGKEVGIGSPETSYNDKRHATSSSSSSRAIHVVKSGGGGGGRLRAGSKEGSLDESGFGPRSLSDNVVSSSRRRALRLAMLEVVHIAITASSNVAGQASSSGNNGSSSSSSAGSNASEGSSASGGGSSSLLSSSNGSWFWPTTPIEGEVCVCVTHILVEGSCILSLRLHIHKSIDSFYLL